MHALIAETVALKPHLETAGEVALTLRAQHERVSFAWLGDDLPWTDWELPRLARLAGCSLKPRLRRFKKLMRERDIAVLEHADISVAQKAEFKAWADAFDGDLEALKQLSYNGALLGMGVASSLISLTRNSLYDPRSDILRTRACLYTAAIVYGRALALMKRERPDQLVTFNGRFVTSKPIVEAAKKLGVPVLRHERGSTFERYELFDDAVHNYGYIGQRILKAWNAADPATRDEQGHSFYKRRRGGDGLYWYSFTTGMQKGLVPERIPGKRRFVYYTSSDDEYAAVTDVYTPGPWPNQLAAVKDLIDASDGYDDLELVMRIHPNMAIKSDAEQQRWLSLMGRNLRIIAPNDPVDSYALSDSADIVISYGSTIGMEAAYWGKPTILIGPGTYAGHGVAYEPRNREEIKTMLALGAGLAASPKERCLPYGYYNLTFGQPFKYYQPTSLSEGTFLGERLGWDPDWVYWLRKQGLGKLIRKALPKRK